jgi:predicted O-methyltransferase YrrM
LQIQPDFPLNLPVIYELKVALKTIQQEGLGSLLKKIFLYFSQMAKASRFFLLKKPHNGSPESVVDFSFNAAGGLIYPGQVRSEFVQIAGIIQKRKPKVLVEIGTANGGTLSAWCAMADEQAIIISIDLPGGIHGGGYAYWRTMIYRQFSQPKQTLHLLRADSHQPETLVQLKKILPPDGVDFLFIDGDHTYEGVKADFETYSPLVRKGGMIALHDICLHPPVMDCHVDKFWIELRGKYKSTTEIIEDPKQGGFGIGLVEI